MSSPLRTLSGGEERFIPLVIAGSSETQYSSRRAEDRDIENGTGRRTLQRVFAHESNRIRTGGRKPLLLARSELDREIELFAR